MLLNFVPRCHILIKTTTEQKGQNSMAQAATANFQIDTSADNRVDVLAAIANFFSSFNRALTAAQYAEAKFYSNRWNEKASQELRVLLNN